MAQWVKVLAAMPDDLSSLSKTRMAGENQLPKVAVWPLYTC